MPEVVASEQFPAPDGLEARGQRLWANLSGSTMQEASSRTLLEEACRTADRLERLDALLRGDAEFWARVTLPRSETDDELILRIDTALSEARQQQAILQRLLAAVVPVAAEAGGAKPSGDILDEVAAKREGRPAAPRRART